MTVRSSIHKLWLILTLAAAAALVLAGCTRFGAKQPNGSSADPADVGIPVEVAQAQRDTMAQTVTVTGTIRAERQTAISPQISARVLSVAVREGDPVTVGQVLITLDSTQAASQSKQAEAGMQAARARLEAAQQRLNLTVEGSRQEEKDIAKSRLEQAQSALRTAQADLARLKELYVQGAVSKQQLDNAQTAFDTARTNRDAAQRQLDLTEKGARPEEIEAARKDVDAAAAAYDQAKAALAEAKDRLTYTVIRSPLNGIVYQRNVEPGEIASTGGDPILQLADLSSVYYEATVPERAAEKVRAGQRVNVMAQGDGERQVQGTVERVVPVANPASRDFLVRIEVPNDSRLVKPGMFARGLIVVQENPNAVVVPKDALVERDGKAYLFAIVDGKAQQREVAVGITDPQRVEILSGIEPGETVVVVGAQGLQDGDAVQVKQDGGE